MLIKSLLNVKEKYCGGKFISSVINQRAASRFALASFFFWRSSFFSSFLLLVACCCPKLVFAIKQNETIITAGSILFVMG